jgi:hypothetical protein
VAKNRHTRAAAVEGEEVRFAIDSPVEEAGFELLVPRKAPGSMAGIAQQCLAFCGIGKRRKLTCIDSASFVRSKR